MARHKPISKARWLASQKSVEKVWQKENLMDCEFRRIQRCYLPLLEKYHPDIADDTRILELFCGPICSAQAIEGGKKTYLDPLLDDYRRTHPGKLPKGKHLSIAAEKIPKKDASFDIILCFNGLDQTLNPELALNEIERLLKPDGTLIIGLTVLPSIIARLRYTCEHFFGIFRDEAHPYSYSLAAISRALLRHFDVIETSKVAEICLAESRWLGSEYAFICKSKTNISEQSEA